MTAQDLYRIRDFVPDFDTIAAEFAERSRALSARADVRADIPYGSGAREVVDVIVPERQLSLAIGKEGQNARLAAKLTGWRIDIRSEAGVASAAAGGDHRGDGHAEREAPADAEATT